MKSQRVGPVFEQNLCQGSELVLNREPERGHAVEREAGVSSCLQSLLHARLVSGVKGLPELVAQRFSILPFASLAGASHRLAGCPRPGFEQAGQRFDQGRGHGEKDREEGQTLPPQNRLVRLQRRSPVSRASEEVLQSASTWVIGNSTVVARPNTKTSTFTVALS